MAALHSELSKKEEALADCDRWVATALPGPLCPPRPSAGRAVLRLEEGLPNALYAQADCPHLQEAAGLQACAVVSSSQPGVLAHCLP